MNRDMQAVAETIRDITELGVEVKLLREENKFLREQNANLIAALTKPQHETVWHSQPINNQQNCPTCGKRMFGFSIPRMGIHEIGDFCMCVNASLSSTASEQK